MLEEELLSKEEFEAKYGKVETTIAPTEHTLEEANKNGIETEENVA